MDKYEAQYQFWSSFGVEAFEETSVPDRDDLERNGIVDYITYQAANDLFGESVAISASVWSISTSWLRADTIAEHIEDRIKNGGEVVRYDEGTLWFTARPTFIQNMGEPNDDRVRRKLISATVNFH